MYTVIAKYKMYQEVYVRHDSSQQPKMITMVGQWGGSNVYGIANAFGSGYQLYFEAEISDTKNESLKLNNNLDH